MKTEVLHQPPSQQADSPQIGTDDTNRNAVGHFTYLGRAAVGHFTYLGRVSVGHFTYLDSVALGHFTYLDSVAVGHFTYLGSVSVGHFTYLGSVAVGHFTYLGSVAVGHFTYLGRVAVGHFTYLGSVSVGHFTYLGSVAVGHFTYLDSVAVGHFTYLGSIISYDAAVSKPKSAVPLEDCHREHGKVIRSASPQKSRHTELSSFPPSCTVQRPGFSKIRLIQRFHQCCLRSTFCIKWKDHVSNQEVLKRASSSA